MPRYALTWNEHWCEWRVICRRTGLTMWAFARDDKAGALSYLDRLNG